MENTNFQIERLNLSHVAEMANLYGVVFRKKVTSDYFKLKYGLMDAKIPNFSKVLLVDKMVVGFFGVRIVTYQRGDEVIQIPHTGDYFLLDNFRGTGLFQMAYERIFKELKTEKFEVVCAFQSEQTYKISQRWGWKDAKHLQRFHIVSSSRFFGKLLKTLGLDSWRFKRFKKAIQEYLSNSDLSALNKSETHFSAVFDRDFYRMKEFIEHFQVTIADCTVWLKWQGNLSVGFVYFHENANILACIEILKQVAKKAFIHETVIHLQAESEEAIQLGKYISPQDSFKVSSLLMNKKSTFDFNQVKLNFMEMDIF